MALQEEWHQLTVRYSADQSLRELLWEEIADLHSVQGRFYHTLQHLSDLLGLAASNRALLQAPDAVKFAIYYHDLVYNPLRRDNEEESARLAAKNLSLLGLPQQQIAYISRLILATKDHASTQDSDTRYFLDFDLAILSRDWEKYYAYTQQIRKEYSLIPTCLYQMGRRKVLKHFLSLPAIYKTEIFHRQHEAAARSNLARELELLGG